MHKQKIMISTQIRKYNVESLPHDGMAGLISNLQLASITTQYKRATMSNFKTRKVKCAIRFRESLSLPTRHKIFYDSGFQPAPTVTGDNNQDLLITITATALNLLRLLMCVARRKKLPPQPQPPAATA
jgi:hypothetical protein